MVASSKTESPLIPANAIRHRQGNSRTLAEKRHAVETSICIAHKACNPWVLNSHDQVLRLLVWGSQRLHPERERCFDLLFTAISNFLRPRQVKGLYQTHLLTVAEVELASRSYFQRYFLNASSQRFAS